jgi:hypothetical protein
VLALLLMPALAAAQAAVKAEPNSVMKKLAVLEGEWRGSSWSMVPGRGRVTNESWEKVERKLDGLLFVVHGKHSSIEKADSGKVTHEAVAMVFFDNGKQQLRVVPVRMDGTTVETWAKETEKGMDWGFALPGGAQFRYVLDVSDPNAWVETGEFSRDGTTWMPVIGLNLRKVK